MNSFGHYHTSKGELLKQLSRKKIIKRLALCLIKIGHKDCLDLLPHFHFDMTILWLTGIAIRADLSLLGLIGWLEEQVIT